MDLRTGRSSCHLYHKSRVGALGLCGSNIITGSRDRKSKMIDLRVKMPVMCFGAHFQKACGLSLSSDCNFLTTGENDNEVFVLDLWESCAPLASLSAWTPPASL